MAERAEIIVRGVVQGVGFRPFVFGLAERLNLKGYVTNTSEGVLIDVEGDGVREFLLRLRAETPPLARIADLSVAPLPLHGYSDFSIGRSRDDAKGSPFTLLSPDVSVCDDCLLELNDPSDRRYLYPFINCTNCGPRYSITRAVPYDRANTTMADFVMCPECKTEYDDPRNRRFHAQPNACPVCGPEAEFRMIGGSTTVKGREAVKECISLLKRGGIVAIKGIGGFHLACDAGQHETVAVLRARKRRNNKPFAVMMPDPGSVERFCEVSSGEQELLSSFRRPIVLLRKSDQVSLSEAVAPNNHYFGCMLPYTPLHYLLFFQPLFGDVPPKEPHFSALVMTSGNRSEEPIVCDNAAAMETLAELVDGFLLHDRDIRTRVDDSVIKITDFGFRNPDLTTPGDSAGKNTAVEEMKSAIRIPQSKISFIRRSRGFAPETIPLNSDGPEVLGCGADLKNTFTLTKGSFAIPSQHIGDMDNYESLRFFEETLANLEHVYRVDPRIIVHDLHPGYQSTQWALDRNTNGATDVSLFAVQHHYAHIGSVMAEYGIVGKTIGVAFDGTGYGTDGALWGGEFLIADIAGFERQGHLEYLPLPGGESAIREPWKTAVSWILNASEEQARYILERIGFIRKYGKGPVEDIMTIARSRELSPPACGAGRYFDAVSALLGICDRNTFEGEAAIALESLVVDGISGEYPVEFSGRNGYTTIDLRPCVLALVDDVMQSFPNSKIATKFHNTMASVIQTMVRHIAQESGLNDVALSGGTFQNDYLLKKTTRLLRDDGMRVFTNRHVPCNDGGISLGQAYLVRERVARQGAGNGSDERTA